MTIQQPYVLFLGDAPDPLAAKVAQGIKDWRPGLSVGQITLPGCKADMGLKNLSISEAVSMGAKTLVIGVANRGGVISDKWKDILKEAIKSGLDIASGLHNLLRDESELVNLAKVHNTNLIDVRVPTVEYPIANGIKRTGKRCLAVGTDCSIGKMYTAIALEKEMKNKGLKATFRATGQTGILITGDGVPLDAVIADFMAGSIEHLTPDNDKDHWDIIEGQGSLYHPSYSGVTMALVHGGQPDALILCHEPTRTHMRGLPGYSLPSLKELNDTAVKMAKVVNKNVKVIGISINTSNMEKEKALEYLKEVEQEMKLPTVDPVLTGTSRLVAELDNLKV
tara:strand:+ start:1044 stop:2054 length:1011 start_codon:yes stop_codon:yes gene_type:complete